MIAALIKGTDWYRDANIDSTSSAWWKRQCHGVDDGFNGAHFTAFKTDTASIALVVDAKGPAVPIRGFVVLFYLAHEREELARQVSLLLGVR